MPRTARIALVLTLFALAAPSFAAAALRMPVGFEDDPTFRWSPNAPAELDKAAQANASIVRTTVSWATIAATKPKHAARWNDPAYNFNDLDAFVRNAQERGLDVMMTIWGTPSWANGGQAPNVPPKSAVQLRLFAHALADRYSGRHPGLPYVGFYSIWNEPNLGIFLSTQFDKKGRIISPRIYANLYKQGRIGIKQVNKTAQIAIGETSNMGRDHPSKGGGPVSVAPATFARLLAQQKGLYFDAYAEHPYSTRPNLPPTQRVRWPNVTLSRLKQFETSIDKWFHRKDIPVWVTEYGYQTKPATKYGVSLAQQRSYMSKVMRELRADPRVQMFIWFIFRDTPSKAGEQPNWQSGLFTRAGHTKPAYRTFSALGSLINGYSQTIRPRVPALVTLHLPRMAYTDPVGTPIGLTYKVYEGAKLVAIGQPQVPLRPDATVKFAAVFSPDPGATYTIEMTANDANGNSVTHTYALLPASSKAAAKKKH